MHALLLSVAADVLRVAATGRERARIVHGHPATCMAIEYNAGSLDGQ